MILLLLLLPSFLLNAQILFKKKISIDDGLAYSQVVCGAVDSVGYLWFGTVSGLSRWDGKNFVNYNVKNGLYSGHIIDLIWSSTYGLVVATQKGINFLKNKKIILSKNYPQKLKTRINSVLSFNKKLLIATDNNGLWQYDGNDYYQIKTNKIKGLSFHSLFYTNSDSVLVGTNKGIFTLSNNILSVNHNFNFNKDVVITKIIKKGDNTFCIGTLANGLFIFSKNKKLVNIKKKNALPSNRITDIIEAPNNSLYIATDEGVAVLKNEIIKETFNSKSGLKTDFIWEIIKHKQFYYFLTDGDGFYQYAPNRFEYFDVASGLSDNTVWNFGELNNNSICIATDNGISIIKEDKIKKIKTNKKIRDDVITIFPQNNTIFLGTNDNGVAIYKNNKFTYINKSNGLTSRSVWSIIKDNDNNIYFSTFDGGICVYNNGEIVDTLNTKDGLPNNNILTSYKTTDGTLYFSVDEAGVFEYKNKKFTPLCKELSRCIIWAIKEDKDENLLLGSNNIGLLIYQNGVIDTLDESKGLTNNSVVGIALDNSGKIYASTDKGLNIIEKKQSKYSIHQILKKNGLPSNECNQNAIFKDSKDNIWIGTIGGALKYSPSADKKDMTPPKLVLSKVKLFNKEINFYNNKKFNYDQNFLDFEFAGINFASPHKTKYAFILEGVNKDWIFTKRNYIQYANLDDGEYNLSVKAANEWNIWSKPIKLNFTITPAFWKTWWFITILVLLISGVIIYIIINRMNHLLAIERLRTKISADLHDDIGSGLSEISFLNEIINYKIDATEQKKISVELNKIGEVSRKLIDSMSDIVWLINPKNESLFNLISRLGDSYQVVLASKNILLELNNIDALQKISLTMEVRQDLYLLIKEGINNSLKYSNCSKISLITTFNAKTISFTLSDNGKGFNPEKIKKGNGLNNMEMRAKKLGGTIIITSKIGIGTEIKFVGKI